MCIRDRTDTWTDADGNTHTETYRVPYDYYICNVKLENFNLSHVPVYIMSQEQDVYKRQRQPRR